MKQNNVLFLSRAAWCVAGYATGCAAMRTGGISAFEVLAVCVIGCAVLESYFEKRRTISQSETKCPKQ